MSAPQYVTGLGAGTIYSVLAFTPADSGSNGLDVVYRVDGNPGDIELSGGQPIAASAWSLHSGQIYKAICPVRPFTLYHNGLRITEARTPTKTIDTNYVATLSGYDITEGVSGSQATLQYKLGDIDPSTWNQADLRVTIWTIPGSSEADWFTDTKEVSGINTTTRRFSLVANTKFFVFDTPAGARYFCQGPLALLTAAGMWAWSGGVLYYWQNGGGAPGAGVVVPTVKRVVTMLGTDHTTRVSHIELRGLAVKESDFAADYQFGVPEPTTGYEYWNQNAAARQALVYLEHTDHITLTSPHLKNSGFCGLMMCGYAQNNVTTTPWIQHCGTYGYYIQGEAPGGGDVSKNNTLYGPIVGNCGELAGDGMGISINQSGHNQVTRFLVYLCTRNAVRVTGWIDTAAPDMYCNNNLVQYGRATDVSQDSGEDGAIGVSFTSRILASFQTIDNVMVNGVYPDPSMKDTTGSSPYGMFCDNQSNGQHISNFLAERVLGDLKGNNDSGGDVESNVSWLGGFDETLLDYAQIEVPADHPYRSQAGFLFFESFENGTGFDAWTPDFGTPVQSTAQAHEGTHSFLQNVANTCISRFLPRRIYGTVSAWFYDDASDTSVDAMMRADEKTFQAGDGFLSPSGSAGFRALGVETNTSTDHYTVWVPASTVTTIPRTTGWHHFEWDYTHAGWVAGRGLLNLPIDGSGCVMKIDGTVVAAVTGVRAVSQLAIGDFNRAGRVGTVYWDEILVSEF